MLHKVYLRGTNLKLMKHRLMKKSCVVILGGSLFCLGACSQSPNTKSRLDDVTPKATTSLSIALAYLQLGNTKKAETNLGIALSEQPNSGAVYLGYALYYQQLGDYEKAEAAFIQAKRRSPASNAPKNFTTYLCRKGEYEAAVSHYTSVISISGEKIRKSLLIAMGECYYQQEHWVEATAAFEDSIEMSSEGNDKALLRLTELSLRSENAEDALVYLEQFNEHKVHVTANSLALEATTYELLGLDEKYEQAVQMLATLFPSHELTEDYHVTQRSEEPLEVKADVIASLPMKVDKVSVPVKEDVIGNKEDTPQFHTIKAGETLYRVTRLYSVTLEQLALWNPALRHDSISIGTEIAISAP